MKLDYVSIEKRDGIAIVCFDRKANLNAFNEKLVIELSSAATARGAAKSAAELAAEAKRRAEVRAALAAAKTTP